MQKAVPAPAQSEDALSLGENLRARRRALGLTLQQVAQQAGLTAGFISQIERDITTPSLSSLVSVARVLGVPVRHFLSQPEGNDALTRQNQRQVYSVGDKTLSYERLSSNFPGNVLRSVIVHEPPGHKAEPISHDGEELILVLDGDITIEVDAVQAVLTTGDSLHFPSTQVHSMWNHTNRTTTILWVGTMDVFGEDGQDPNPTHRTPDRATGDGHGPAGPSTWS